mgnify:CR=1 FL=1
MPELPEVERLRRSLEPGVLGRTVTRVTIHRRDVVVGPNDPPGGFSRQRAAVRPSRLSPRLLLLGSVITTLARRGKQLAILGEPESPAIVVHLGMTGQLRLLPPGARLDTPDHVHLTWRFDDGSRLCFRDPRRFGGIWALASQAELDTRWRALGPDAIDIQAPALAEALRDARTSLKAALLDQTRLAGLGNIYADEAAFEAGLAPARPAGSLTPAETDRLASAIRLVLSRALKAGGSTLRDYRDAQGRPGSAQLVHAVYGRAGLPCVRCGSTLLGSVLAQRATVWCPNCQPHKPKAPR